MRLNGFVVVLKPQIRNPLAREYRGLDRVPPWTLEHAALLDVEELGSLEDDWGLIPNHDAAVDAIDVYSRVWPTTDLEVLWAESIEEGSSGPSPAGLELGYDVATPAPFYSLVLDMPQLDDLAQHRRVLNANGIFDAAPQAMGYLSTFSDLRLRDSRLEDPTGQRVWRVVAVETCISLELAH